MSLTVAQLYPARTDSNGTTWYRSGPKALDGWTAQRQYADPSYAAAATMCALPADVTPLDRAAVLEFQEFLTAQSKENETVTELTADGTEYERYSDYMHYPLPPFPERVNVGLDGYNRYKVPSPSTGKLTAFTRATTVAKVTSDDYNLQRWKERMKVEHLLKALEAAENGDGEANEMVDHLIALFRGEVDGAKVSDINKQIDLIDDAYGGAEAREWGGATHDWIAELDMGKVLLHQIPDQFRSSAVAYQECMARAGLIAIPDYTERLVLNDAGRETVVGRMDGIAYCTVTGELHLMDRKTSRTLDFSVLEFGIQLNVYARAKRILALDRKEWEPMPEINQELAFIIHVPSDQPERSQVVPVALKPGIEDFDLALDVREARRKPDARYLGGAYPIPTDEALRYVQAWQALQAMESSDQAAAIKSDFEDVWDDDLDELGARCFELLDN